MFFKTNLKIYELKTYIYVNIIKNINMYKIN